MKPEITLCRALAGAMLLSQTGCMTGFERAVEHRERIAPGMTRADVRARLGEPDAWSGPRSADSIEWTYRYGHGVWWHVYLGVGIFIPGVLTMEVALVILLPLLSYYHKKHGGIGKFTVTFGIGDLVTWSSSLEVDS